MLRVREMMQADVVTVSPETTVRELTRLLSEHGISGAPVVSSSGVVLGVVSSTDVVRLAAEDAEVGFSGPLWAGGPAQWADERIADEGDESELMASYFLPEDSPVPMSWRDMLAGDAFEELTVSDIMTPASFSIDPDATVSELAEFLLRGRIHRAVVSENGHLLGIVTTMDVLRALAERG